MRAALGRWIARCVLLGVTGCFGPPSPAQKVTDAARELNLAARFGRMDVAVQQTAPGARSYFLQRRTDWGKEVRVVDVELAGLEMKDEGNATVLVDVSWVRMREGTLHATRLAQTWKDDEDDGWQLVRERRVAGDAGLFGEPVALAERELHGDVHFPSRTIR